MWNLICGNRVIDRKRKEQAFRKHVKALNNIKSMINNTAPKEYQFLYSRPKANQIKFYLERQLNIENNNNILVDRMMKSSSYIRPKHDALLKESLNSIYRSKMDRQIDEGNQKLVRRLQSAKSHYSNVSKNMKEYSKYKSNMANSRMDPYYDLQNQTAPVPRKNRPYSAKR